MLPFSANYLAHLLANPDDPSGGELLLSNGITIRLLGPGALEIIPAQWAEQPKAIVLSAGIHGNETGPIEWLNRLLDDLLNEQQRTVHPLLLLFGHPQAMIAGKRELGTNLNRLFNGAHRHGEQDLEHQRAAQLEAWMDAFYRRHAGARLHYDLHTAIRRSQHEKFAVVPYCPDRPHHIGQYAFLQHCEVDCLLFFHQPTTTFSYHSAINYDADAFTVELGKVYPFGHNDPASLEALNKTMRQLLAEADFSTEQPDIEHCLWYQVTDVINRDSTDFELNFPDDLPNFSEFQTDEVLARQDDEPIRVSDGPKAVVFPNAQVQIGQRAAILVKELSHELVRKMLDA